MKLKVNKIASVTKNIPLDEFVEISKEVTPEPGAVIAVVALEEKAVYDQLELTCGRMCKIIKGDIIIGALGSRMALEGFVGRIPKKIERGDVLHILNLGGVIGKGTSSSLEYGKPLQVEVLGSVLVNGEKANIHRNYVAEKENLETSAPIVLVSATGMNSGKTAVTCKTIQQLYFKGYRICAAKVTGISLLRDTLNMEDNGAQKTLSISDAGLPSTVDVPKERLRRCVKGILYELNKEKPDIILVELGDGIEGRYGVQYILSDSEIMNFVKCNVVCAGDLIGARGAVSILKEKYGIVPDIISGPVTDNSVGINYIKKTLKTNAANAIKNGKQLAALVEEKVFRDLPQKHSDDAQTKEIQEFIEEEKEF